MSLQLASSALQTASRTITVPRAPKLKSTLIDNVQQNLDAAVQGLHDVRSCANALQVQFAGHLALTQTDCAVNEAQSDYAALVSHIDDLQNYAAFWRRLAQKTMAKLPDSPILRFVPFEEV